jgi:hypothetical protein
MAAKSLSIFLPGRAPEPPFDFEVFDLNIYRATAKQNNQK